MPLPHGFRNSISMRSRIDEIKPDSLAVESARSSRTGRRYLGPAAAELGQEHIVRLVDVEGAYPLEIGIHPDPFETFLRHPLFVLLGPIHQLPVVHLFVPLQDVTQALQQHVVALLCIDADVDACTSRCPFLLPPRPFQSLVLGVVRNVELGVPFLEIDNVLVRRPLASSMRIAMAP